jgi:hypothetical protein
VVDGGGRGRNIIREMGGGVSVCVRRPLLADPLPLPPISTAVTVPKLRASLLDTEYALILAVMAGNFAEAADVPHQISWLHSVLLTDRGGQQQQPPPQQPPPQQPSCSSGTAAGDGDGSSSQPGSSAAAAAAAAPEAGSEADADDADMKRQVVSDFSCTNASLLGLLCDIIATKTTVSIEQAQLMLWNAQPQGLPPASVGSIEFRDMWLSVSMTQLGNMLLWLSLPSVCARDLRPGVPKEASLVLSTAEIGAAADLGGPLSGTGATSLPTGCPPKRSDSISSNQPPPSAPEQRQQQQQAVVTSSSGSSGAGSRGGGPLPSLLTLEYRAVNSIAAGQPAAALQVRLQRPTLVLDVGFILKVLHFVAPTAGLQGPMPRPYASHEIHLSGQPYLAPDHLWLSPEYRIIADAPGLKEAIYDGGGHALVLPTAVPAIEHVPLIVVGRGVTLRLRNVRLVNQAGLAGVLSVGPGGQLVADEADGVSWHGPEETLRLRNKAGRHILMQAATEPYQSQQPAAPAAGSMSIAMHAVGAAVYLIDAHPPGSASAHEASAAAAAASGGIAHGTSIPVAPEGPAASSAAQAADPASVAAAHGTSFASAASLPPGEAAAAAAEAGSSSSSSGKSDILRMLAVYLDLGLNMTIKVG